MFGALCQFCWVFEGFRAKQLQPLVEQFLGQDYGMNRMAYDLRRLSRKGLIARVGTSYRYRLTAEGLKTALFFTKSYNHVFCRGLSILDDEQVPSKLRRSWSALERQVPDLIDGAMLAA